MRAADVFFTSYSFKSYLCCWLNIKNKKKKRRLLLASLKTTEAGTQLGFVWLMIIVLLPTS